jgi:hypothetical protein
MNIQTGIVVAPEVILDASLLSKLVLEIKRDHFEAHKNLYFGVLHLYLLGEKLLQIKQIFKEAKRRDFNVWLAESFPEINYASLVNYMALARVRRAGFELDPPIDIADRMEFRWHTLYELGKSNLDNHQEVRKMFLQMMLSGKDVLPAEVEDYKDGLLRQGEVFNLDTLLSALNAEPAEKCPLSADEDLNKAVATAFQAFATSTIVAQEVKVDVKITAATDLQPYGRLPFGSLFRDGDTVGFKTIHQAYVVGSGDLLKVANNKLVQKLTVKRNLTRM